MAAADGPEDQFCMVLAAISGPGPSADATIGLRTNHWQDQLYCLTAAPLPFARSDLR